MRQKVMFIVPYALWIILFVVAPLALIFYQSFFDINSHFTLANYQDYLTSPILLKDDPEFRLVRGSNYSSDPRD